MHVPMGGAGGGADAGDRGRRKAANKSAGAGAAGGGGDTYRGRMQLVKEAQQREAEAAARSAQ